jgi:hypothetical protein
MAHQKRRRGIWDLLWAPALVLASVAAIMTLRLSAPYLQFIIIAGFAATVVEAGAWLAQARRDRRGRSSSDAQVP